jgi:hypothetical protein
MSSKKSRNIIFKITSGGTAHSHYAHTSAPLPHARKKNPSLLLPGAADDWLAPVSPNSLHN